MTIHLEERGRGDVLLCLHGIGSSSASFLPQLDGLSHLRRVAAWDAPGYAASGDPDGPPGMDGYADAAAEVLRDLGGAPSDVLGASFGGVIAVRLALRHPELVRSLVLADSTPGSGADPDRAAAMRRRGAELAKVGTRAFSHARAHRLVSDAAPLSLVERVAVIMADSIRLPGYAYAAAAMADTDHRADFAALDLPTLVICGSHDGITPPSVSRDIAARIPGARFASVPDAGHLSNQENPTAFNALVASFLGALDERRGESARIHQAAMEQERT